MEWQDGGTLGFMADCPGGQSLPLIGFASHASVAHACNPSYSGGRDQDDHGLNPAPDEEIGRNPISKKPITKKDWWRGSSGKHACLATMRL
jgi:hypothetical protein